MPLFRFTIALLNISLNLDMRSLLLIERSIFFVLSLPPPKKKKKNR